MAFMHAAVFACVFVGSSPQTTCGYFILHALVCAGEILYVIWFKCVEHQTHFDIIWQASF
jgi:hypothetical protein